MVASERRLRLRRRAGCGAGAGAGGGAAARWRASRATADAVLASTEDLDRERFLLDTGAFIVIDSLAEACPTTPGVAEILQDFAAEVQQRSLRVK